MLQPLRDVLHIWLHDGGSELCPAEGAWQMLRPSAYQTLQITITCCCTNIYKIGLPAETLRVPASGCIAKRFEG